MIDQEFYKKDKEFHKEFRLLTSMDKSNIRKVWSELRRKAVKLLNDDLHGSGHEGSIMGMDVSDDEIWKYLEGEEKELFNKYSRFLDFIGGYKPHTENHVKKFKEFKMIKEGMRFNTTYLSLPSGEYNIEDVLEEVEKLKEDLMVWKKGGWRTVSTVDTEHKEIIPLMK